MVPVQKPLSDNEKTIHMLSLFNAATNPGLAINSIRQKL